MKTLLLGFVVVLIFFPRLRAQTPTDPVPPAPTTTSWAPNEVTNKLSNLVDTGKYAEAQELTTGLLVAYPDDQRLIKTQVLLKQLLASKAATPFTPGVSSAAQPASDTGQLTGMDKVDYNALIERARQAQQTSDLDQQKASLKQFMDESSTFLQKHPDQMLLWQIRAASALSLNDPNAGYEAGQKLLAAGAADSNDPNLQQLISKLKIKGWFDQRGVEEANQKIEESKKYDWLIGTWTGNSYWFSKAAFDYGKRQNEQKVEFIKSDSSAEGYSFKMSTGVRDSTPSFKYATLNVGGMNLAANWRVNIKSPNPEWQPITSCAVSHDKRTITIVAWGRTFVFTKVSD
jgi:hypothetical protein